MADEPQVITLIAIREFLRAEGAGVAPWSGPGAAIDQLFALLESRRDDGTFWKELAGLVRQLEDPRFEPRSAGGAAIIGSEQTEAIVSRLRGEIPTSASDATRSTLLEWLRATATAPALLGFLLLGTALGCEDSCRDEAAEHGIEGSQATVYCELVGLINDADIPWNIKINLLDCLPDLDAEERLRLLQAFEWASEDDLAAILEDMSTSWVCDNDWYFNDYDGWGDH